MENEIIYNHFNQNREQYSLINFSMYTDIVEGDVLLSAERRNHIRTVCNIDKVISRT